VDRLPPQHPECSGWIPARCKGEPARLFGCRLSCANLKKLLVAGSRSGSDRKPPPGASGWNRPVLVNIARLASGSAGRIWPG
jgi:hypothetical protein